MEKLKMILKEGNSQELMKFVDNVCFENIDYKNIDKNLLIFTYEKNPFIFIDRCKYLLIRLIGVLTYLRDKQKIEIKFSDLIQMNNPECILCILKETKELRESDTITKEYRKYWIPSDYIEIGMNIPRKQELKNFSCGVGLPVVGEPTLKELQNFYEEFFLVKKMVSERLNILSDYINKMETYNMTKKTKITTEKIFISEKIEVSNDNKNTNVSINHKPLSERQMNRILNSYENQLNKLESIIIYKNLILNILELPELNERVRKIAIRKLKSENTKITNVYKKMDVIKKKLN